MLTKITLAAALAAIFFTSATATYAAPNDRVPEPIYFKLATGEQG
jgi:hypothetical protein